MRTAWAMLVTGALAGCGADEQIDPDAPPRPDATWPDAVPGPCGGGLTQLAGELLDLESATPPIPIAGAELTAAGFAPATTAADGSFAMCLDRQAGTPVAIDSPGDYLDAVAVVDYNAFYPLRGISLRTFTLAQAEDFYVAQGLVFDPALAHVLVVQAGDAVPIALAGDHDAPRTTTQAPADPVLTWGPGAMGAYVLFPNVDPAGTGEVDGEPGSPLTVPLAAGTLTLAVTFWVWL